MLIYQSLLSMMSSNHYACGMGLAFSMDERRSLVANKLSLLLLFFFLLDISFLLCFAKEKHTGGKVMVKVIKGKRTWIFKQGKLSLTFSLGNKKVSQKVLIFNLPSILTCPNSSMCKSSCYARKAERVYKGVLLSRMKNYHATLQQEFVEEFCNALKLLKEKFYIKIIRLHESGDIYSKSYFDKLVEIAKLNEDLQFYTHTKNTSLNLSELPLNFNIISSILPDGSINFSTREEVLQKSELFNIPICPATLSKNKITCMENCRLCLTTKHMLFVKH